MPFADVLGQATAAAWLAHALRTRRVAHAYLFRGPDGVGKTRMALAFTAALLCGQVEADSCGQCRNCSRIAQGSHPDVELIERPPGKRYVNIDQIRVLDHTAHLTPLESRWKVFILRDAERMLPEAQNALLKTLEEPPHGRVLILVTARPDRLLPTILSRCQAVRFKPLTHEDMRHLLTRMGKFDSKEIEFALAASGGSLGSALRLLENRAADFCRQLLPRLERLDPAEAFALAEEVQTTVGATEGELESQRDGVRLFLELATAYCRDLVILAEKAEVAGLYHPARRADALRTARRLGAEAIRQMVELFWRARERLEQNANIRLTLEDALLAIAEVQLQPAHA